MDKIKVMFLCTHNSARSQMAEALLRKYAGDQFEVFSAGLEKTALHPLAGKVMEELGLDMVGHESKNLDEFLGNINFDYLITVCANAETRCPFFPGAGNRMHWPFDDPAAFEGSEKERLVKFRETRDQIARKIKSWLKEIQPTHSRL